MATIIYPLPQVTSSGALPAVTAQGLTQRELVAELHISPNVGNAAAISVYDVPTGIVLKTLQPPANGHTDCFKLSSGQDEDSIDTTRIGVTISGSDKANVYTIIR